MVAVLAEVGIGLTKTASVVQRSRDMVTASNQTKQREITKVRVLPLHGTPVWYDTCSKAATFVTDYTYLWDAKPGNFVRFEIEVIYRDGLELSGTCLDKESAIEFLENRAKGLL